MMLTEYKLMAIRGGGRIKYNLIIFMGRTLSTILRWVEREFSFRLIWSLFVVILSRVLLY